MLKSLMPWPAAARRHAAAAALAAAMAATWPAAGAAQQVVLPDFSELADRVGPSVVNIRTLERGRPVRGGRTGHVGPTARTRQTLGCERRILESSG